MHASMMPGNNTIVRKPTRSEKAILASTVPEEAIVQYPRIIQETRDPVVQGKKFMLMSYVLFEPGKSPDPEIAGVAMIRDTPLFNTAEEAVEYAKKMIRTVDSLNVYYPVEIAQPYILSKSRRFVKNEVKVPTEKSMDTEDARQQADSNMSKMIESYDVAKSEVSKQEHEDEKQQLKRIREMRLKAEKMDQPGTIEYYTKLRSKYENLLVQARKLYREAYLLDHVYNKAYETRDEIMRLNVEHPEYETQWVEEYTQTLAESGIKTEVLKDLLDPREYAMEKNFVKISNVPKSDQ